MIKVIDRDGYSVRVSKELDIRVVEIALKGRKGENSIVERGLIVELGKNKSFVSVLKKGSIKSIIDNLLYNSNGPEYTRSEIVIDFKRENISIFINDSTVLTDSTENLGEYYSREGVSLTEDTGEGLAEDSTKDSTKDLTEDTAIDPVDNMFSAMFNPKLTFAEKDEYEYEYEFLRQKVAEESELLESKRLDAKNLIHRILNLNYLPIVKETYTVDVVQEAIIDFVLFQEFFIKNSVKSFIKVPRFTKKQHLWFYEHDIEKARDFEMVFLTIGLPFVKVDHVLRSRPIVAFYRGGVSQYPRRIDRDFRILANELKDKLKLNPKQEVAYEE